MISLTSHASYADNYQLPTKVTADLSGWTQSHGPSRNDGALDSVTPRQNSQIETMHDGIFTDDFPTVISFPPLPMSVANYAFAFFAAEPFGVDPDPDSDFRLFSISSL